MEWRCEWCGKPHEEDDPPCDNCGHGKFEKAVVRQTDLAEESGEAALVWVCTDCGREHPKNNPPCSRCGNLDLEKQRQRVDQSELSAPGYLDLLTPQYLAAATVVLLLAVVFVLGFTGVVDVPGFDQGGIPAVDAPGNESYAGTASLTAVEDEFTDGVNDRLTEDGRVAVQRDDDMNAIARYINKQYVQSAYGSESPGARNVRDIDVEIPESVRTTAGNVCGQDRLSYYPPLVLDPETDDVSADTLGTRLAEQFLVTNPTSSVGGNEFGVDAHHGPDGSVFLLVATC